MFARPDRRLAAGIGVTALVVAQLASVALASGAHADPTGPTPVCSGATCTVTFGYTGHAETFTVPAGITSVSATVDGAAGGTTSSAGLGGRTSATLAVHPGDGLTVVSGQQGAERDTAGTFGGGGGTAAGSDGSSGGGGSFVFSSPGALLLAAGGGGGYPGMPSTHGGSGGGATGGTGAGYPDDIYAYTGATGGTQSAGGTGGQFFLFGDAYGTAGTAGTGPATGPTMVGHGGNGGFSHGEEYGAGGGGGGGYYGGGAGGHYQAAGGGSGYAAPSATAVTSTVGANSGAGSVTFSWQGRSARHNPTIKATVSSGAPKSATGWYSRPVTVRFSCTTGTGALVGRCPAPVKVTRDGKHTVTRTIRANDGGAATRTVTVKVDRTRPSVAIRGVRAGHVYAELGKVRCAATDKTSGIAACRISHTVRGSKVTYRATAVDRAGHSRTTSVTVVRPKVLITGANYRGTLPVVRHGKTYTLVVISKSRPTYVNASPAPRKPNGVGGTFTKAGKNRWLYTVTFYRTKSHSTWNFGVQTGRTTIVTGVRIK